MIEDEKLFAFAMIEQSIAVSISFCEKLQISAHLGIIVLVFCDEVSLICRQAIKPCTITILLTDRMNRKARLVIQHLNSALKSLVEVFKGESYELEAPIDFTWEVTSVDETTVDIQLLFVDPLSISNNQDFDYHAVEIEVLNKDFFRSEEGGPLYEPIEGLSFTRRIPLQRP